MGFGACASSYEEYHQVERMYKYFEVNMPCMNERPNSTENQAGPCGILCGSCPMGGGTIAEAAGRTRQNIADCEIPKLGSICAWGRGDRLGGSGSGPGLDGDPWPLRRMRERRRPSRLHHQGLRPRERIRPMQLLRGIGGLHQVRMAQRSRPDDKR